MPYRFSKSLIYLSLVFLSYQVNAEFVQDKTQAFLRQTIVPKVREFGSDAEKKLFEFREHVEAEAYTTGLKLCKGYHHALGQYLELPPNLHTQCIYKMKDQGKMVEVCGQEKVSMEESVRAWLYIIFQGASQPLSAMFGKKAHYLEQKQIGLWDLRTWMGSLYSLHLINSFGFLSAAIHCLNVDVSDGKLSALEQRRINRFAATVLWFDYSATLMPVSPLSMPIAKATQLIVKAGAVGVNYTRRALQAVRGRIGRAAYKSIGIGLGGILADNGLLLMEERASFQDLGHRILDPDSQANLEAKMQRSYLKLNLFYESFLTSIEKEQSACIADDPDYKECSDSIYREYHGSVLEQIEDEDMTRWKSHRERLESLKERRGGFRLSEDQKTYGRLLEAFLPILESLYNQPLG